MHSHYSTISCVTLLLALATSTAGCSSGGGDRTPTAETASALSSVASASLDEGKGVRGAIVPRLPNSPMTSASTVPGNGDVNPYGVAFVPPHFPRGGLLRPGDIVVSNFNNSDNLQGTGTTIVRANANASPSLFFTDTRAPGFSTALGVLEGGFVLVGSVPSTDGTGVCNGNQDNVGQGEILVINRRGKLVTKLESASLLDGPWDLTVQDFGRFARVFVSNVKSGTVTRLDLRVDGDGDRDDGDGDRDDRDGDRDDGVFVLRETQIASGYAHRCDPAAFVVGPTGVALDPERDILYVASTADNAIFAVEHAGETGRDRGTGRAVVTDAKHLHGPLGLVRAPNGDLISAQGDAVNPDPNQPSEVVEFTAGGRFVAQFSVDPAPGSAFGLALAKVRDDLRFAAVDDGTNVLDIWDVE